MLDLKYLRANFAEVKEKLAATWRRFNGSWTDLKTWIRKDEN